MPKWAKILIGLLAIIIIVIAAFLIYLNVTFISKDEAKNTLVDHLKLESKDIYFENIDLELEKNQYEIDFYYNNNEYEAKIDAKEGKVIYTNFNKLPSSNQNTQTNTNEISIDQAKDISLKHANLDKNNVTLIKAIEENDEGKIVYEIEWKDSTYEYDFDISKTGEIINYDKDKLCD